MDEIAKEKRHHALNTQLSEVLHQYLLACDALHLDRCADIGNNLNAIQSATIECYRIMVDHKIKHRGILNSRRKG